MSTAPATAASPREGTSARLRNLVVGALFAAVRQIPKLLYIRRNAQSWMVFRMFLGFAGAALVILPLSFWSNWVAAIAGLAMFLAAILLPPAQPHTVPEGKASELGALAIVNGGKYQPGPAAPAPVQLFIGKERICALNARLETLLVIPAAEITSATAIQEAENRWTFEVRSSRASAEFFYQGIFAERRARAAQSAVRSVMRTPLPVLRRSRAASA